MASKYFFLKHANDDVLVARGRLVLADEGLTAFLKRQKIRLGPTNKLVLV